MNECTTIKRNYPSGGIKSQLEASNYSLPPFPTRMTWLKKLTLVLMQLLRRVSNQPEISLLCSIEI